MFEPVDDWDLIWDFLTDGPPSLGHEASSTATRFVVSSMITRAAQTYRFYGRRCLTQNKPSSQAVVEIRSIRRC